jgi:hypothetical protein
MQEIRGAKDILVSLQHNNVASILEAFDYVIPHHMVGYQPRLPVRQLDRDK